MGRRVTTRCTHEAGVREPWALYQVYANVGWPHASLRVPWRPLFPTHGTGSATPGRPRPPAMAAGLTERVWPLREVLLFRVPPWPQPVEVSTQGDGQRHGKVA